MLTINNTREILERIENYKKISPIIISIIDSLDDEKIIDKLNKIFTEEKLRVFLYKNHDLLNHNSKLSDTIIKHYNSYAQRHLFEVIYADNIKIVIESLKGIRTTLYSKGKKYEVGKKYWM